jgi:hypothetical protein
MAVDGERFGMDGSGEEAVALELDVLCDEPCPDREIFRNLTVAAGSKH